ncbi:MAG: PEP/pyruvate-binding domain-containing protein [Bacteroidales bacterium]
MPMSNIAYRAPKYYFSDTSFQKLMRRRIHHVLLISSTYDAFVLEDDGRIDEQIFNEYVSLNLRYPPQFILASSEKQAFDLLHEEKIDLVIVMLSSEEMDTFSLAEKIKKQYEAIPIVVLTPFSREVTLKLNAPGKSVIDYIFSWLGNADLLLAIIKLIEDKMNVDHDIREVGVQAILLVEDSIRFYSSYLPNIYKIIFKQSKDFMTEGLNEHQMMLRMRGRPKIMLATTYEEALMLYEKYKRNLLGIITDMSYPRNGKQDKYAGVKLCEKVQRDDPFMPILLQSSDVEGDELAKKLKVGFISKNSKTISFELKSFIREYFAFGDFIFIDPETGDEIVRATDLKSLQELLFQVPDDALRYHLSRNQLSKWLRARALFPLAEMLMDITLDDFQDLDEVRRYLFDAIASFRISKARGVIAQFQRERFDEYLTFTRIGDGSIGGKARGLAFLDMLIKRNRILEKWQGVYITIPRTVVLCTDVFDEFMEDNNLYEIALSDRSDDEILREFIQARLPFRIHEDLYTLIAYVRNPIAVRSSSLLEDSHYQPFAGIYSTYMVPYVMDNERLMMEMLSNAIKSVYASTYFKGSKAYMAATSNVIDEEKMGIVMQTVAGTKYGNRFYPSISGVARSINFYPLEPEKPEDGVANVALGLGKYIVDGGLSLHFSPKYPKRILQTYSPEAALRETQKYFYALDMHPEVFRPNIDDGINILKLPIKEAEADGSLKWVGSTYDLQNGVLRDGVNYDGKKLVTFSNILKHNIFPLAEILQTILEIGQKEMGKPIEIEFAVDLNRPANDPKVFYCLQIRPIVDNKETISTNLEKVKPEDTIVYSKSALGNGVISDLYDLVYIKPESFNPAKNQDVAERIGKINEQFRQEQKNYILIGPGRWGSQDSWLGIPVKWPQISAARVIIESGLENYRIDPSQGTHFFQNLTSFRVGYFTINPYMDDGHYDLEYLSNMPAVYEDEQIRHIRFEKPLTVEIDGKKNLGVIYKP